MWTRSYGVHYVDLHWLFWAFVLCCAGVCDGTSYSALKTQEASNIFADTRRKRTRVTLCIERTDNPGRCCHKLTTRDDRRHAPCVFLGALRRVSALQTLRHACRAKHTLRSTHLRGTRDGKEKCEALHFNCTHNHNKDASKYHNCKAHSELKPVT